jgi:hypothetical protein
MNRSNICTRYNVGPHRGGIDYLVMKFQEGESLTHRRRGRCRSAELPVEKFHEPET